ncbi:MAG: gamma-glutamyl-gamma-aminobutyrate hydrolase family protein [Lachnospiraceae bacterium]|nr:gamma-glutamyl-gamma-aminobutyrate hydrolase family protein [Lachnospiraceae bacterium]
MPMIGLIPLVDENRESYWMLPGYMTGLEAAGAIPVMLPLTANEDVIAQLVDGLDGFLLTGGHDVDPALYGEAASEFCGAPCGERDRMERLVLDKALRADKPVLGICRGLQYLNVYLGGTLYQDLPSQHESTVEHHMHPPYDRAIHTVTVRQDSWLSELLGVEELAVNSYHHQAIWTLAPGLEALAVSEDGLVEAVRMPDKRFVVATQWHPEFSWKVDENSRKLFRSFAEACSTML